MGLSDVSPQCQATLDSWCNDPSHCPHAATHGRLHARFDRATMNPASAWRCYAEDTLSPDLRSYVIGYAYCTRQPGLQAMYIECRDVAEPTRVQVSSTGASVALPVPASPSPSPSPLLSPSPSPPLPVPPEIDLRQWEALEPWTHEGVLTVPAVQLPDSWAPSPANELLAVHAWRVGCMEDYEAHRKNLEKYTGNVSRRKAFLKRHGLKVLIQPEPKPNPKPKPKPEPER